MKAATIAGMSAGMIAGARVKVADAKMETAEEKIGTELLNIAARLRIPANTIAGVHSLFQAT